jgi:hypothetical protein
VAGAGRRCKLAVGSGRRGRPGRTRLARGAGVPLALVATILVGVAALPVAEAGSGSRPKIIGATATWHRVTKKVAFSVEIHRHPSKVVVIHGGARLPASKVANLPYNWETRNVNARKRRCYPIRVKARNHNGLSTRRLRAGRIGSRGCRHR